VRGYASWAERYQKQRRLQHLQARLAVVERRLAKGRVSVCRGGRRLAKLGHHLDKAGLPASEWRGRWHAERLFLAADGEAEARWGNLTIRVHPDEHWLELRLPTPLAYLSIRRARRPPTGCRARSYSTTAQTGGPRRPPGVRSATTSATSPTEAAGT
jgi:hypothetical protein